MANVDASGRRQQLTKSRVGLSLIATFALGASLLVSTIRVPRVVVVIKLITNEVGFQFEKEWEINDFPLSELTAANWSKAELFGEFGESRTSDASSELVILGEPGASAWSACFTSDYLRLNLTIPAETQTRLSVAGEDSSALHITIAGQRPFASLDTGAELLLRCNSCLLQNAETKEQLLSSSQSSWRLRPAHRTVSLYGADVPSLLAMRAQQGETAATKLALGSDLRALKIDFQRADAGPPLSAISGPGTIAFPGLETEPVQIEPGDFLYIASADSIEVRRITIGECIEVELRGAVSRLEVGPSGALRSKMPTLLQYVYWNSWLQMVVGAALTAGATISSVLYRFGFLSRAEK